MAGQGSKNIRINRNRGIILGFLFGFKEALEFV